MSPRSLPAAGRRRSALAALAVAAVLVGATLTACSGAGDDPAPPREHLPLTVGMPNAVEEEDNNPFDSGSAAQKLGYAYAVFEPLAQFNANEPTAAPTPWLASSWEWNEGYTRLRVVPRAGVTWSDGEPFTAQDVAYSFRIRMENPALNPELLPYEDVAVDGDAVVVSFSTGQFVNQTRPLSALVVPEHRWSELPTETLQDEPLLDPVGTGPYVLDGFSTDEVRLVARDDYWGGPLAVPELRYRPYEGNEAITAAYVAGDVQWGWAYITEYETVYIDADPDHYHQFAPTGLGIDALFLNTQVPPFDDVAVRRAVNAVINRDDISLLATSGVWRPLHNATGLPQPAGDDYIAPRFADADLSPDLAGAAQTLADAGYELEDGVLLDPDDGAPVTFTLTNPEGWSDYMWELEMIAQAVEPLGIVATVEGQDEAAWFDAIGLGEFQASMHWTDSGATPWDTYSGQMNGSHLRPLGERADWNFGRFQDERADEAFVRYASTTDPAERTEAMETIQEVYVDKVPAIPLLGRPNAAQYSTRDYTGFPSASDPYASPQPTNAAASLVLTRLRPSEPAP